MFVLTVHARTINPEGVREHVLTWPARVGIGAVGWLGSTGGVSTDGDFILLMRFESEEAAWITSDLPENGRWWQICSRHLDTRPAFTGSSKVTGILSGGSDDAAAVRIIRGRTAQNLFRDSLRRLETLSPNERAALIGGIVAWHERDQFTEALYLKSKDFAKFRQRGMFPTPLLRFIDEHETSILDGTVIDLDEPWLISPSNTTSGTQTELEVQ